MIAVLSGFKGDSFYVNRKIGYVGRLGEGGIGRAAEIRGTQRLSEADLVRTLSELGKGLASAFQQSSQYQLDPGRGIERPSLPPFARPSPDDCPDKILDALVFGPDTVDEGSAP